LAQGWVEVFAELTEEERRLGELPGFTPERLDQWLEQYPADQVGRPAHTGGPAQGDPTGNVISTPVLDEAGPNIVEARKGGDFTTPGGNVIGNHGEKGDGKTYTGLKGQTPEQIDEIIKYPVWGLSGYIEGKGPYKGTRIKVLTGIDGHWVKINESGKIIQMSNRRRPLWDKENDSGEIIEPLEQP